MTDEDSSCWPLRCFHALLFLSKTFDLFANARHATSFILLGIYMCRRLDII